MSKRLKNLKAAHKEYERLCAINNIKCTKNVLCISKTKKCLDCICNDNSTAKEKRDRFTPREQDCETMNGSEALSIILSGGMAKRSIVKNDTVMVSYKKRLYQLCQSTGVRYPCTFTNADLHAADWVQVFPDEK